MVSQRVQSISKILAFNGGRPENRVFRIHQNPRVANVGATLRESIAMIWFFILASFERDLITNLERRWPYRRIKRITGLRISWVFTVISTQFLRSLNGHDVEKQIIRFRNGLNINIAVRFRDTAALLTAVHPDFHSYIFVAATVSREQESTESSILSFLADFIMTANLVPSH
jgi:hypothetical protein